MKAIETRYNLVLAVGVLLLTLLLGGWNVSAEELTNDSRYTAVAVRITFMINVMIWDHGDEFDHVEPASGLSNVFVFSGGEVRRHQSFEVEWSPDVPIKSVEWLEVYGEEQQEEMELVRTCSCVLSPGDDLQSRIDQAYDGMEICLEPGTYELEYYVRISADLRIRGLGDSPEETQITCPNYSYVHIASFGEAQVRIENLSFVVPKYSQGSISAAEDSRLQLENVWVSVRSRFSFDAANQATMQVSNCRAFSFSALHQSQLTVSGTILNGDLGTEYGFHGISAYQEAKVTISNCAISHYWYALNMKQDSQLTMTNCSVKDIDHDFLDCEDFTGSIQGAKNSIDAPLGKCLDLLPKGFSD